jgi:hypothetical protein
MNDRIRELTAQTIYYGHWEGEGIYPGRFTGQIDVEKLVNLLIRECAAIVTDAVDQREPASTYADKIKQHFGVNNENI